MILSCPACGTRYLLPDNAVPPPGRQVRCASCRHSWFEAAAEHAPDPAMEAAAPSVAEETTLAPPPAAAQADRGAHPTYGSEDIEHQPRYDAYEPAPYGRPRRNPARLWTLIAVAAALAMLAATAMLIAFGPPEIARRFTGANTEATALLIQSVGTERRPMASGNELFSASGRIVNPTNKVQRVPDIRANLLDAQDRVVYGWTIARPVATLAPGGSVEFNGAVLDVPKNARNLDLSLAAAGG